MHPPGSKGHTLKRRDREASEGLTEQRRDGTRSSSIAEGDLRAVEHEKSEHQRRDHGQDEKSLAATGGRILIAQIVGCKKESTDKSYGNASQSQKRHNIKHKNQAVM